MRLIGIAPNAVVKTGDKFRVTWKAVAADWFSPAHFDLREYDTDIREALPGMGFIPVSNPMTTSGSAVIVYDVRLNSAWGVAKTAAEVTAALDRLPLMADLALNVDTAEFIAPGQTSVQLAAGQTSAVQQANEVAAREAETNNPFKGLTDWLKGLSVVAVVGVVAVAGLAVYLTSRRS